jgi:hypothetical protein
MTITAQTAKSGPYNGNGSTTVFSYTFKVADEADLVVTVLSADGGTETVKTLTTDYTVSGVGNAGGGSITMLVAPVTGEKLTITRSVDLDQEVDLQNRGSVNPQTLEDSLDKLTQIAQDQQQQLDRSLKVDLFETADLATLTTNVNAVAAIATEVGTVAGISSDVTAVAGDAADIGTVAGISSEVGTVAGISSDVTAVAADATDIGTVAGDIADVSTVAGISSDVTSVAGISADVTTVAGISSDVTAVAGDAADIGTVAGISADVTSVAGISANVTTVAGISSDVTSVAADAADIGTVAGISTEIGTVAGISADVSTVAGDSADIQILAPISADIQALTAGTGGALTGDWTASGVWEFTVSSYLGIPRGTTAERGSPGAGIAAFRYNEDDATFEGWDGTAWGGVGGGAGLFKGENGEVGSSAGDIFRINEQELNTNVTIDADENASATGPLAIASGVTLTVTSGGNLSIV